MISIKLFYWKDYALQFDHHNSMSGRPFSSLSVYDSDEDDNINNTPYAFSHEKYRKKTSFSGGSSFFPGDIKIYELL